MLTAEQIKQYKEQGYVLVSGLFTEAELNVMETEFDGIIERRLQARASLDATWSGEWRKQIKVDQQIIHTHDLQLYSAAWARVLTHDRLTETFSDCLGTPNVQLHHTKLFQKPPERGSAFPMHQDAPYFPHDNHSMMAGIIHLSDATEEMGCVVVYPGSQKLGLLPVHDPKSLYLDPAKWTIEGAKACPAKRGDVLFFNYLTVHGSNINSSKRTRKTVLIQVRDPMDKPTEMIHISHAQGMMMRGIDPQSAGDPAKNKQAATAAK